jgi:hypothetical protein
MIYFVFLILGVQFSDATKRVSMVHDNNPYFERQVEHHCTALKRELAVPSSMKNHYKSFGHWWQSYWEPTWSCPLEERVQKTGGDGGKWVCDVHSIPRKDCLVYSFGSNGDYSFEHGIIGRRECEIHTFDPFNSGGGSHIQHITVHSYGLGNRSYTTEVLPKFGKSVELKSLTDIVKELGHSGRTIDILKVDVDGSELNIFDSEESWKLFESADLKFNQLLIELHFQVVSPDTFAFRDKNNAKTAPVGGPVLDNMLRTISSKGFAMFHKEVNLIGSPPNDACEFGFVWVGNVCEAGGKGQARSIRRLR